MFVDFELGTWFMALVWCQEFWGHSSVLGKFVHRWGKLIHSLTTGIVNTAFCQNNRIQSDWSQTRFKYSVCLWAPPTYGTSCTVGFTRSFSTPLARQFSAISITLCGPHSYNFVSAYVFAFRLSKNLWQHSKKHPVRRGRCGLRPAHMMLGVDVSTELITLLNVFHP